MEIFQFKVILFIYFSIVMYYLEKFTWVVKICIEFFFFFFGDFDARKENEHGFKTLTFVFKGRTQKSS